MPFINQWSCFLFLLLLSLSLLYKLGCIQSRLISFFFYMYIFTSTMNSQWEIKEIIFFLKKSLFVTFLLFLSFIFFLFFSFLFLLLILSSLITLQSLNILLLLLLLPLLPLYHSPTTNPVLTLWPLRLILFIKIHLFLTFYSILAFFFLSLILFFFFLVSSSFSYFLILILYFFFLQHLSQSLIFLPTFHLTVAYLSLDRWFMLLRS